MYKRILKQALRGFLAVLVLSFLFLLMAIVLAVIPVNRHAVAPPDGIEIYVSTNGVHTDLILPLNTPDTNWQEQFPAGHFRQIQPANMTHIAFGWGDRGFYLDTPTWDDLTLSTAVRALLLKSATAMHVTYYRNPQPGEFVRSLMLTSEQHERLIAIIQSSFARDARGNPVLIPERGYRGNDTFYAANGSYSLFNTCNDWTGRALRRIGVKTGIWTPFSQSVMYHL
ncbi:MAG: TIGR02117 family protein [Bacteroidota bacterium]